jgi:hypothetical protein
MGACPSRLDGLAPCRPSLVARPPLASLAVAWSICWRWPVATAIDHGMSEGMLARLSPPFLALLASCSGAATPGPSGTVDPAPRVESERFVAVIDRGAFESAPNDSATPPPSTTRPDWSKIIERARAPNACIRIEGFGLPGDERPQNAALERGYRIVDELVKRQVCPDRMSIFPSREVSPTMANRLIITTGRPRSTPGCGEYGAAWDVALRDSDCP